LIAAATAVPVIEPATVRASDGSPAREMPRVIRTPEPAPAFAAPPVDDSPPLDDSEGPEWPDEAVEAAMRVEQRERDQVSPSPTKPNPAPATAEAEEDSAPLPKLDALIGQIPPAVRDTLEELFRARFTSVQRVPKSALK
jgi:hypothetical protein